MTTKKKTIIVISLLSTFLLLAIAGLVVALVAITQSAKSQVKVHFTASDVSVRLSATAYAGGNKIVFKDGDNEYIDLTPNNLKGELSQEEDTQILLDPDNKEVVFEYKFLNLTDTIDVEITSTDLPKVQDNVNMQYAYADEAVADLSTLTRSNTFENQLLPAYEGEETVKYIYIFASVKDALFDADLEGIFGWGMGRAETIAVNLSVDGAVNTVATTGKALASTAVMPEPSVYPATNNAVFLGWATTPDATEEDILEFPINLNEYTTSSVEAYASEDVVTSTISAPSNFALYPVYKAGNIDDYLAYDSTKDCYYVTTTAYAGTATELVIPDYYNDGTNGLKPVGYIADGAQTGEEDFASWLAYNKIVTKLYVGYNITSIGMHFASLSVVSDIIWAKNSSITSIGDLAFNSCSGLINITIPNSVTSIGNSAFYNCSGLTSITIPSSVTSIGGYAFGGCSGLTSIAIPEGVTSIEYGAFTSCSGLTSITIPSSVTSIGNSAFSGCSGLASITIPEGVKSIGARVFTSCDKLTSITIPSSVTSIGIYIFDACYQLVQIRNLSNVTISYLPSNPYVEVIGRGENFSGTIEVVNNKYNVYNYDGKKILLGLVNNTFTTADDIPTNITEICQWAFLGCRRGLTSATIPSGVSSIGDNAFRECDKLTSLTIPSSVKTIGRYVFYSCTNLTRLTIEGDNSAWTKSSSSSGTYTAANADFSNPTQNATWFKSTSGYYNYYWKRA